MQVYISKNNQKSGPFEESAVLEMLRCGQLSPNDYGIKQGQQQWQKLEVLFPQVKQSGSITNISAGNLPTSIANMPAANQPPKTSGSKGLTFALIVFGGLIIFGVGVLAVFLMLSNKKSASSDNLANSKNTNSNVIARSTPPQKDFTELKNKAEELAALSPPVKFNKAAKLAGKIAIVEKGKYTAEVLGFDSSYTEKDKGGVYGVNSDLLAETPKEIDSLVQIICTKGRMIGRYEGNIFGYANNCRISLIDYRNNFIFAQKTLTNSTPEKSVSSVYDNGEYVVIPPISDIRKYLEDFITEKAK